MVGYGFDFLVRHLGFVVCVDKESVLCAGWLLEAFGFAFDYNFFSMDNAAIMRNVIPAQKRLPVKNQTASARSIAGISTISSLTSNIIITPITSSAISVTMSI